MPQPCMQETRIAKLETKTEVNIASINNLADKIGNLTTEIRWFVRLTVLTLIGIVGFFIKNQLGG